MIEVVLRYYLAKLSRITNFWGVVRVRRGRNAWVGCVAFGGSVSVFKIFQNKKEIFLSELSLLQSGGAHNKKVARLHTTSEISCNGEVRTLPTIIPILSYSEERAPPCTCHLIGWKMMLATSHKT
jgi:hypothetical protein